jgi:hypothetical protein
MFVLQYDRSEVCQGFRYIVDGTWNVSTYILTIMDRAYSGSLIEKSQACTKPARSLFVVAKMQPMGQTKALQGSTAQIVSLVFSIL